MPANQKNTVAQRAMLATLRIDFIGMSEIDRKATITANQHLGATSAAGNYQRKKILTRDISIVDRAARNARWTHNRLTRPWEDTYRMLPASMVLDYTQKINKCKQKFESAVKKVEKNWLTIVSNQQKRLGPLFNPKDYPCIVPGLNGNFSLAKIVDLSPHFTFTHSFKPMPEKGHYMLDLADETMDEIKKQLEKENNVNLKRSRTEMIKRLYEPVLNMADICSNDKKVYETLIPNVEDAVEIMHQLNVECDSGVNDLLNEVRAKLTGFTAGQIRDDKDLKKMLGNNAKKMTSKMDFYMDAESTNPN